jgi:hypothetical protein
VPVNSDDIIQAFRSYRRLYPPDTGTQLCLIENLSCPDSARLNYDDLFYQSDACRLPVLFYSGGCFHEAAYYAHPKWRQQPLPHTPNYHGDVPGVGAMCPNSPFVTHVLLRELSGLGEWKGPLGLWIHNAGFDGGMCGCQYCLEAAEQARCDLSLRSGRKEFRRLTRQKLLTAISETLQDISNSSSHQTVTVSVKRGFRLRRLSAGRYFALLT